MISSYSLVQTSRWSSFSVQTGALRPSRGLGWLCNDASFMGTLASPRTFGHTGFTGTSIVLDLRRRLSVILLTNRVHPVRSGPSMAPVRSAVADAAAALGGEA
ncbi:MAG TPA: serine hydrolase [Chloroflexota bacterium]|nr:serine hydrolase [Chloroflexota bacterium]